MRRIVNTLGRWVAPRVLLIGIALSMSACGGRSQTGVREGYPQLSEARTFLSLLVSFDQSPNVYSFITPKRCWVSKDDAAYFVTRIHSEVKSASVKMSSSSTIRNGSTEGDEAAFLLRGFQKGIYPPSPNSGPVRPGTKEELLAWWASYKSGTVRPERACT